VADRILRKATAEWWLQNFLLGIDEHSLLYLAIRLERFYMSMDELQVLENLTSLNPGPTYAQSDTGLEFIGHDVSGYSRKAGTSTAKIEPWVPWQDSYARSFNIRSGTSFSKSSFEEPWPRFKARLMVGVRSTRSPAVFGPPGA